MKKILLLSPFFYPEPISTGKYNSILTKALVGEVDSIDVLCSHPVYPKWKVEPTTKQLNGVSIIRGGKCNKYPSNPLLRRAVLEVWFLLFVLLRLVVSRKKYSHIVPVFPPSLFMLVVPFFAKSARVVGIVHDLQGVYANKNAGFVKRLIFGAIKLVEKRAFKNCDHLIFLSEDMRAHAAKEYSLSLQGCSVHYPFITISEFSNNGKIKTIIPDGDRSVVYSGALGEKQAPECLAELMVSVKRMDPTVNCYIFSQGPEYEALKSKYADIHFHPLVDEGDLPELLIRSSVQVLPQADGTSDGSLPSKMPNLLASGCKVLCVTDPGSELVRLLESYSRARVEHGWDIPTLSESCLALLKSEVQVESDEELLNKFRIESLIERIKEC